MTTCLSFHLRSVLRHICFGMRTIRKSKFWKGKWPRLFVSFFTVFFFLPFLCLLFCSDWTSTGLVSRSKASEKASSGRALCHGVAGNVADFFAHISEYFRAYFRVHRVDHSDLGIIGKVFSSCRSWVWIMPFLVKGNDVRSRTKAKALHGRLRAARESMGERAI